jgi:hypothetical protein
VKEHASTLLKVSNHTELAFEEAVFTFAADYIELCPNSDRKDGWAIEAGVKPAEVSSLHSRSLQYLFSCYMHVQALANVILLVHQRNHVRHVMVNMLG